MRLVLATRNAHKAREFAALLAPHEVEPLPDGVGLPPETGATFEANALLKARAAAAALGRDAIADDSGICVEALGGAPGVRSARYAGERASDEENLAKLLREAPAGSAVAYVCALAHVTAGGDEEVVLGRCTGTLAASPRGTNGFGYDPAFVPDDLGDGRTMAELDPAEKDAISHRGRAARALLARLGRAARALPARRAASGASRDVGPERAHGGADPARTQDRCDAEGIARSEDDDGR